MDSELVVWEQSDCVGEPDIPNCFPPDHQIVLLVLYVACQNKNAADCVVVKAVIYWSDGFLYVDCLAGPVQTTSNLTFVVGVLGVSLQENT